MPGIGIGDGVILYTTTDEFPLGLTMTGRPCIGKSGDGVGFVVGVCIHLVKSVHLRKGCRFCGGSGFVRRVRRGC